MARIQTLQFICILVSIDHTNEHEKIFFSKIIKIFKAEALEHLQLYLGSKSNVFFFFKKNKHLRVYHCEDSV